MPFKVRLWISTKTCCWAVLLLNDGCVTHARPNPPSHQEARWRMPLRRIKESSNDSRFLLPSAIDKSQLTREEVPLAETNGKASTTPSHNLSRFYTTVLASLKQDASSTVQDPAPRINASPTIRRNSILGVFPTFKKNITTMKTTRNTRTSLFVDLLFLILLSKWAIGVGVAAMAIHRLVTEWFPLRRVSLEAWERMGRDQLPEFWNAEILATVAAVAATENGSTVRESKEDEDNVTGTSSSSGTQPKEEPSSSPLTIPITKNRPDLQRRLKARLHPLMKKRVQLMRTVVRIIMNDTTHSHNKKYHPVTKTTQESLHWSDEECQMIAMFYAERTVETLAPVTQALSERLELDNMSKNNNIQTNQEDIHGEYVIRRRRHVDRSLLVQGLADRIHHFLLSSSSSSLSTTAEITDNNPNKRQRQRKRKQCRRAAFLTKVLDEPTLRDLYKESLREAIVVVAISEKEGEEEGDQQHIDNSTPTTQ